MTESWFINAILITLAIGIVAFINKIFAERKYDQKFSTIILYGITSLLALIYGLIVGLSAVELKIFLLVTLFGVSICLYSIIMMTALRYLSTSVYFVNVRLVSSFILLFIGIIFFRDHIALGGWTGFFIGVIAMILLFEDDKKYKKSRDYKKGIGLLLLGVVSLVFGHSLSKLLSMNLEIIPSVLLILFTSAFSTALLIGHKSISENKKYFWEIFKINFIQAMLFLYYFVMLFKVYSLGALGISYKIQSYSPFVPIVLAAIVYREKISFRKKIALVLVAVSLWFFK